VLLLPLPRSATTRRPSIAAAVAKKKGCWPAKGAAITEGTATKVRHVGTTNVSARQQQVQTIAGRWCRIATARRSLSLVLPLQP
jgi:hypothetical protein